MLKSLKKQTPKRVFSKWLWKEYSFILSLILLLVIATCVNPNFFSSTNITNLLCKAPWWGLLQWA